MGHHVSLLGVVVVPVRFVSCDNEQLDTIIYLQL